MRINGLIGRLGLVALTGLVVGGWSASAGAATKTVNLKVMQYLKCLPKEPAAGQPCAGEQVRMWGFVETNGQGVPLAGAVPSSPGPTIVLGPTHDVLRINLRNELPADADPFVQNAVSVVVPGLQAITSPTNAAPPQPVTFTDPSGRTRIRSLTQERLPGTAARSYFFRVGQPGTYLYHSGTHPAVQVQMGLYGAVKKTAVAGEAYPGIAYDREVLVVYSEVDRQLHADVDSGKYVPFGNPQTQTTSTIHYTPVYYLVNGKPFDPSGVAPLTPNVFNPMGDQGFDAGVKGGRTLIRVVNAGLKSRIPVINGGAFKIIAEDGKPYAYPRSQVSAHIAAGQTLDLLLETPGYGVYTAFDRALGLSNADGSAGGQYAKFVVHDNVVAARASLTNTGRLQARATSNHDLPTASVTMTAWGTYASGEPRLLGTVPFISKNATTGVSIYEKFFDLAALNIPLPDAVMFVSSLGGSKSRAVVTQ